MYNQKQHKKANNDASKLPANCTN